MPGTAHGIEAIARSWGLPAEGESALEAFARDFHLRLGTVIPADLSRYATIPDLSRELARAYDAEAVFPRETLFASRELGPGLRGKELWLMTENQGVCLWAVPLDAGDTPPVLVSGDLSEGPGAREYAANLDDFVGAWAWDRACLEQTPLIQAQAAELDRETKAYLGTHLQPQITTWAWPTRRALRFESSDGLKILLWDDAEQCDWFLSGANPDVVGRWVEMVLPLSDLATSLWSNDDQGEDLLRDARAHG